VSKPGPGEHPGHGTDTGYNFHMRWDRPPCADCREAHRQAVAAWRAVGVLCKDCGQFRPRGAKGRCGWCYTKYHRATKKKAR
jgi:hypothetical protein